MKYLYYDLGEQQEGSWVVAHLRGSSANVMLLDPLSFDRYRFGQPFQYTGGLQTRTPTRLRIPQDGQWYLVIDCGGYRHHVHAQKIEVVCPDESPTAAEADTALVGANA
jgi:Domain of unknown function (DUF1883)